MLEKKKIVQKVFRLDSNLESALSRLAKILDCSQNELVEIAIRKLIKDNESWFMDSFTRCYYEKINTAFYDDFQEDIYDYRLSYIPYNFQTRTNGKLILSKKMSEDELERLYEYEIPNGPDSRSHIMNALGDILKKIAINFPEILEKYNISLPQNLD